MRQDKPVNSVAIVYAYKYMHIYIPLDMLTEDPSQEWFTMRGLTEHSALHSEVDYFIWFIETQQALFDGRF